MIAIPVQATSKTGVGFSQKENSFDAGVDIANMALANSAILDETLFLLFASPQHKIDKLIEGIRSVAGDSPKFLGCTTTGLVTHDFIAYTGTLAGGAFISSDSPFFNLFLIDNIKDKEFEAGKGLANKIQEAGTAADRAVLLFYDSIKVTATEGTPMLNLATPILEGFEAGYKSWPTMAGIGAWGDINVVYPCAVWAEEAIKRHGLAATTIGGKIKMDTIIMHGTRPAGGYHTITKAIQNVIYEIDGQPALDVIDTILGGAIPWEDFPLLVTLGVNSGDKFGDFVEDHYASRLCFAIDRENKALVMFETDLVDGTEVQLMNRNIDFKYIRPQIDKLLTKVGNRKPLFAFYIDCLGRVSGFSGLPDEEALEVARVLHPIPFFGIMSGVEIANVGPAAKALDWTGVVCLFSEE